MRGSSTTAFGGGSGVASGLGDSFFSHAVNMKNAIASVSIGFMDAPPQSFSPNPLPARGVARPMREAPVMNTTSEAFTTRFT
jgi:hypothetical protein